MKKVLAYAMPIALALVTAATTAGLARAQAPNKKAVQHDTSLQGAGTVGSPLHLSIRHDTTLTGDGTELSPLHAASASGGQIPIPLVVEGDSTSEDDGVIQAYAHGGDGFGSGVYGVSGNGSGVYGEGRNIGVHGFSSEGRGVDGGSTNGPGVVGISDNGIGVYGTDRFGTSAGVFGEGYSGNGVVGISHARFVSGVFGRGSVGLAGFADGSSNQSASDFNISVFGNEPTGPGTPWSGYFNADVGVVGRIIGGGSSFKIDHPLDPANEYLYHSAVESPDMMNIYNGNITTDSNGEVTVRLPGYFSALNRDFRYQLTVVGQFAQAVVAAEIEDNEFVIKTDKPNVKVSWQVTGVRQDAWANAQRVPVEERKSDAERGYYLHPELFSQPEEKGILWAHNPEMMQSLKQQPEAPRPDAQAKP